jgi:hypothetical protein
MESTTIAVIAACGVSVITSATAYWKAHQATKTIDMERQIANIAQKVLEALKEKT